MVKIWFAVGRCEKYESLALVAPQLMSHARTRLEPVSLAVLCAVLSPMGRRKYIYMMYDRQISLVRESSSMTSGSRLRTNRDSIMFNST